MAFLSRNTLLKRFINVNYYNSNLYSNITKRNCCAWSKKKKAEEAAAAQAAGGGQPKKPEFKGDERSQVTVLLGGQYGNEGKGRMADYFAKNFEIICKFNGGAGNTASHIITEGKEHTLNYLPASFLHPDCEFLLGNGVLVNLGELRKEIENNSEKYNISNWEDRFKISNRIHLISDLHQTVDNKLNGNSNGIGPTLTSKVMKSGIRIADLVGDFKEFTDKFKTMAEYFKKSYPDLNVDQENELKRFEELSKWVAPFVCDTSGYILSALDKGKRVLAQGSQSALLDIDLGTYPYVTSSNTTIGSVCAGLGIAPRDIGITMGVIKAYTTMRAPGPFPTECLGNFAEHFIREGKEVDDAGNPFRVGWLDLPAMLYAAEINGYTSLALTNLGVLDNMREINVGVIYKDKGTGKVMKSFPATMAEFNRVEVVYETLPGWMMSTADIKVYEDLPANTKAYIKRISAYLGVPVNFIGVGSDREAVIPHFTP